MHSVMLVDDEIFFRQGLRALIDWEACGFQVVEEADNGEDAFKRIHELNPDLVVTDIRMPVMDGLELIRQVTEQGGFVPRFIIISGYDDFKYAQQAVRYGVVDFILKPVDEQAIEETLTKLDHELKQDQMQRQELEKRAAVRIIRELIKNEANDEQVREAAERLKVRADDMFYYVFVEANDVHPWSDKLTGLTLEQLAASASKVLDDMLERTVLLLEHRNRIGWVCAADDLTGYGGSLSRFSAQLQKRLSADTGALIRVFCSVEIHGLKRLAEAYQSAKDALQYRFAEPADSPVLHAEINSTLQFLEPDTQVYRLLLDAIEEMDEKAWMRVVNRLFRSFREERYAPEAVKLSIHHCVAGILKVFKDMEADESELKTLEPMLSWQDRNMSLNEVRRLFIQFLSESADMLASRRKMNSKGNIQRIKEYIDHHYHENISLKSIAARFYMNSVYLGQLFKKTYGVYFNEYVLQLRVQKAKKLLRQTDLRIYEVAEQVGFGNPDYFVTQFEKLEGITPSAYRNKLLQ